MSKELVLKEIRKKEIEKEAFYRERVDAFKKNLENGSLSAKEIIRFFI